MQLEEGCILPPHKIEEIEDNYVVLKSLEAFCKVPKTELLQVLNYRNEVTARKGGEFRYGYKSFSKKEGKKRRTLHEPVKPLKIIQNNIKERLNSLPVSLYAMAGKAGDKPINHVMYHKENPYLITIDIKNAFPSISTQRVFRNFQGVLNKPLGIWFPYMETKAQKELFTQALTHLCVCEGKLPQGAPTSSQIQNIAMTSMDIDMLKTLPNIIGEQVKYSRYGDDMAISFPNYETKNILDERLTDFYHNMVVKIIKDITQPPVDIIKEEFASSEFLLTDKHEFKHLSSKIDELKELVTTRVQNNKAAHELIGILNGYKQQVVYNHNYDISYFQEQIYKIVSNKGRRINQLKTKKRTPQSNRDREIIKFSINKKNEIGISRQRKSSYERLFTDLLDMTEEELLENEYYQKKFSHNGRLLKEKILRVIVGIYKGHVLKISNDQGIKPLYKLKDLYEKLQEKYKTEKGNQAEETTSEKDISEEDDFPF